jgi:hypothetical protein
MGRMFITVVYSFLFIAQFASGTDDNLATYSSKLNKTLPEVYDHATKLMRTRVENNHLNFEFIVRANKEEFAFAFPKVRSQILSTICHQSREGKALRQYKVNVVYLYESEKGQALGEFMVKPDHCTK